MNILDLLGSQRWRAGLVILQVLFRHIRATSASHCQLCPIEGYGWIWRSHLGSTKLFLPVICRADHSAPIEHPPFARILKMASWRPFLKVLFRQLSATSAIVSYVQLKDTAGSGGVILGPTKLCLPVFCRTDHSAPFENPRFAWISKMASWRSVLKILFRRIRATSASQLCPIEG